MAALRGGDRRLVGRRLRVTTSEGIMEYVKLGASNLKVSRLSLGGLTFGDPKWRPYALGEAESRAIIRRSLDHGINLFDTSNYYSLGRSEEIVGGALKDFVPR